MAQFILIYLISIPLCLYANKLAYKKTGASVIPILWFIPVINSVTILVLIIGTLLTYSNKGIFKSSYWIKKWSQ